MRNQEWDSALAKLYALDLAQLVLCLFRRNAVDSETTLGVIDEAEVFARLGNRDDVHEPRGIGHVRTDLAINFDETLHEDRLDFAVVEGIFQPEQSR